MEAANKTSTLASCLQVFRLSFRRQFFTRQTIVMVLLLGRRMVVVLVLLFDRGSMVARVLLVCM